MKKKAVMSNAVMYGAVIVTALLVIAFVGLMAFIELQFPSQADKLCEKIGMKYFDGSSGGIFSSEHITCYNPLTNETRVIK